MSAKPTYVKQAVPQAVPASFGEMALDTLGRLTWFDGVALQAIGAPIPTLIVDATSYTIADNTQVFVLYLTVDGDLSLDGDLVEM